MSEDNDLLMVLLRMKSFLISLVDTPDDFSAGLTLSEEYLERKFPEQKESILEILENNGISSDSEIVFDQSMMSKFKDISDNQKKSYSLDSILELSQIDRNDVDLNNETIAEMKSSREAQIKQIISLLMKIANEWINRQGIEEKIDDFSKLDEEEMLRPYEEEKLENLSIDTNISFSKLSTLSLIYIKMFTDYLFEHGGNISLKNFLEKQDKIKNNIEGKYKKLFEDHGLKDME